LFEILFFIRLLSSLSEDCRRFECLRLYSIKRRIASSESSESEEESIDS
jgi:hypothetical protein